MAEYGFNTDTGAERQSIRRQASGERAPDPGKKNRERQRARLPRVRARGVPSLKYALAMHDLLEQLAQQGTSEPDAPAPDREA